ncbi:MAG: hypothetical protein ACK515_14170 [bacterium]|jgi:hypothetical protein|nr:hypothetical protein [Betaproteobacteria bacterium]
MASTNPDLLQPSLTSARVERSPYSQQAHVLSAFFGGPLSALAMSGINAYRLRRIEKDAPWLIVAMVLYLSFEVWLAIDPGGQDFVRWAGSWAGSNALTYVTRALALAFFAIGTVMHRREHTATDLMGLKRPSGWILGFGLVAGGILATTALRNLLQ